MYFYRSIDGGSVWQSSTTGTYQEYQCAMKVVHNIPGLVFFGGQSMGGARIARSTDSGEPGNWTTVLQEYDNRYITSIVQDPVSSARIMACGYSYSGDETVFWKSEDQGVTWESLPNSLTDARVTDLQILPGSTGGFLCASNTGVYRTEDGIVFTKVLDADAESFEWDPVLPGMIFVSTSGAGVLVSEDDGLTWSSLPSFFREDIPLVDLEVVGEEWLYAGTDGFGVFRTSIAGAGIQGGDLSSTSQVTVVSSPCTGSVTLTVAPLGAASSLSVFDLSGRIVHRQSLEPSSSERLVVISDLIPGIYFTGLGESREFSRFIMLSH